MTAGVQIGFSQRIKLEWLERTAALCGVSPSSNREKAISILMRTWVQVPDELRPLRDEGIARLRHLPPEEHVVVHWGMALAVYPFFGEVAESAGRLLRLQGTAASAQIQRRLWEQHGQRETVARAARRVLRCYIDWGVLSETKRKGVYQARRHAMSTTRRSPHGCSKLRSARATPTWHRCKVSHNGPPSSPSASTRSPARTSSTAGASNCSARAWTRRWCSSAHRFSRRDAAIQVRVKTRCRGARTS